jgi:hypothetical protein
LKEKYSGIFFFFSFDKKIWIYLSLGCIKDVQATEEAFRTQFCIYGTGNVGQPQCFGSVFIFSGSGSRVWGWRPIRIRIQSGSRALMTKNWKKITAEKKI